MPLISEISSAVWKIFVEIDLLWQFGDKFRVIALASNFKNMLVGNWAFDISNLDGKVNSIFFCLEWSEKSINILDFIWTQSSFRILNLEYSEIIVVRVQRFKR